jgi:hypothetical protein
MGIIDDARMGIDPIKEKAQQDANSSMAQTTNVGEQDFKERRKDERIAAQETPTSQGMESLQGPQEGVIDPEVTQRGWAEEFGHSLVRGFGKQVIGGTGDVIQAIHGIIDEDAIEGNLASRWLQEAGNSIAEGHENYLSEDFRKHMEDNAWSIKTFMEPEFWSNDVAEGIPMLLEMIFLSKGISGLAKKGALNVVKKVGKKGVRDVAGLTGKGIDQTIGAAKLGEFGAGAVDMAAGGVTMNMYAGLMNSAELVNMHKNDVDENGNPLYTNAELSQMAATSFTNNMAYLPVDALSWGLTYGNAGRAVMKGMKGVLSKPGQLLKGPAESLTSSAKMFAQTVKPMANVLKKRILPLSKPAAEGLEETFQESFEEWAKLKAKEKSGIYDSSLQENVGEFMDFYNSKENQHTKAVSMALGMLGGAGSNVANSARNMVNRINEEAEKNFKYYDKAELLKNVYTDSDMKEAQMEAVHDMMLNDMYHDGKVNMVYIEDLHEKEAIDDEVYKELKNKATAIEDNWGKAELMNVRGKMAYGKAKMQQVHITEHMAKLNEEFSDKRAEILQGPASDQTKETQIKKYEQERDQGLQAAQEALAVNAAVQESLLSGDQNGIKPLQSKFVTNEDGNEELINGLTPELYNEFYTKTDEEVLNELKKNRVQRTASKVFGGFADQLTNAREREVFKNIFTKVKDGAKEMADKAGINVEAAEDNNQQSKGDQAKETTTLTPNAEKGGVDEGKTTIERQEPKPISGLTGDQNWAELVQNAEYEKELDSITDQMTEAGISDPDITVAINKKRESLQNGTETPQAPDGEQGAGNAQDGATTGNKNTKAGQRDLKEVQSEEGTAEGSDRKSTSIATPARRIVKMANKGGTSGFEELNEKDTTIVEQIVKSEKFKRTPVERIAKIVRAAGFIGTEDDVVLDYVKNKVGPNYVGRASRAKTPTGRMYFRDIKNQTDHDTWVNSALAELEFGYSTMSKVMVHNQYLRKLFPGTYIKSFAIQDLYRAVGEDAVGYALGSTVYIEPNQWEQDDLFMHEFSHIYYATMKDTQEVEEILKAARADENFRKSVEQAYWADVMYRATKPIPLLNLAKGDLINVGAVGANLKVTDPETFNKKISIIMKRLEKLPDSEQEVINDELFANYLQGKLSKEFNKFFDPKKEPMRQRLTRNFWNTLKRKSNENDAKYVVESGTNYKTANPDEQVAYDTIVRTFKDTLKMRGTTVAGRRAVSLEKYEGIQDAALAAVHNWEKAEMNMDLKEPYQDELDENTQEDVGIDGYDWDKTFERISNKARKILNSFIKRYKQNLRAEQEAEAKEKNLPVRHRNIEERHFVSLIMNSAREEENPFVWSAKVMNPNTENHVLKKFQEYMKQTYGSNRGPILRSMHKIYNNQITLQTVFGHTDSNGNTDFLSGTSYKDMSQVNWMSTQFIDNLDEHPTLPGLVERIRSGRGTDEDYKSVIQIATESTSYVFADEIIGGNTVNFQNGKTDIKTFLDHYLGMEDVSDGVAEMMMNIVTTNAIYSSDAVVRSVKEDKNGFSDYTASKHLRNALFSSFEEMQNDLKQGMSKRAFLNKYTNMTSNEGKYRVKARNELTEFIYDNYQNNNLLPDISLYLGDINDRQNKNVSYKDTDAESLYVSDVIRFLKGDNAYLSPLNTMGESKRSMMTMMPKYEAGTEKARTALKRAYQAYVMTPGDKDIKSLQEWSKGVQDSINQEVAYFQAHSEVYMEYNDFINPENENEGLYNSRGVLTSYGKRRIADYVTSTIINKAFVHELLTPTTEVKDIVKRNKMNNSPFMRLSHKLKFENVPMPAEFVDAINELGEQNDSGQYITDVTAARIEEASRGVLNLNKGYKMVNNHIERDNPNFRGRKLGLKGYVTILSAEQVEKFPALKPIYDLLNKRQERFDAYAKENGVSTDDVLEHPETAMDYIAIASPVSSEKQNFYNKEQLDTINNATLEALADPENMKAYEEFLDGMYYDENGEFMGLSGNNFGPQMRMDEDKRKAKIPVQMRSAIMVNAGIFDNIAEAEEVLSKYNSAANIMLQENLLADIMHKGVIKNDVELAKFILKNSNPDEINPRDKRLLEVKNASIHNPWLSQTARNLVKNLIIKNGNNLQGPGTIAQQKSEVAGKQVEKGKPSMPLEFYREANGKVLPMEGILPAYMKDMGVRKRKYAPLEEVRIDLLSSRKLQEEFGIKGREQVEQFIKDHSFEFDGKMKYYIPGENVLATRVPSSGPSFTGVMEAVDFDTTGASNVMIPTKFKETIGSDDDGDQLFISIRDKGNRIGAMEYNEFFDSAVKKWLTREMQTTLTTKLDDSREVNRIIEGMTIKGKRENPMPFSPAWAKKNHNDALGASQTVGIAFNLHRIFNSVAAYKTPLRRVDRQGSSYDMSIGINGQVENQFNDNEQGVKSRIHKSNTITQIVLDSSKNGHTEALGFSKNSIGYAMILTNLGFDLGTVGEFLNHPTTKEYVARIASKDNLYAPYEHEYGVLKQMVKKVDRNQAMSDLYTGGNIDLNNDSKETKIKILGLLDYMNKIHADIEKVNKVMKGHKEISPDPFVVEKQMQEYRDLVSNKGATTLLFSDEFSVNPEAEGYLSSMKHTQDIVGKMSIEYSPANREIYNEVARSVFQGFGKDYNSKLVGDYLKIYNEAKYWNINNKYTRSELTRLIAPKDFNNEAVPGSAIKSFEDLVNEMLEQTSPSTENAELENTAFHKNKFLNLVQAFGVENDMFNESLGFEIKTTPYARSNSLSQEEIQDVAKSFDELPADFKEKILVADLVLNGWKGNNSIFPFLPDYVIESINENAGRIARDQSTPSREKIEQVRNTIINLMMSRNAGAFKNVNINVPVLKDAPPPTSKMVANEIANELGRDPSFFENIAKKKDDKAVPVLYYKLNRRGNDGQKVDAGQLFIKVTGIDPVTDKVVQKYDINKGRTQGQLGVSKYKKRQITLAKLVEEGRIEVISPEPTSPKNIDLLVIPDEGTKMPTPEWTQKKKFNQKLGRAARADLESFTSDRKLTPEEYMDAQQFRYGVDSVKRNMMYQRYLKDKDNANALAQGEYRKEKILKMKPDQLLEVYKEFAKKDIYAYSNIIVPVLERITHFAINEQQELTGVQEGMKDISVLKAYLQTNNIDSSHPGTQYAQRMLEGQYKSFINEKKQFTKRINEATNNLYNEKFNDQRSSIPFFNRLTRAAIVAFTPRNTMYEKLYGNLVKIDKRERSDGTIFRAYKMHSPEVLKAKYLKKQISKSEYEFAQVFQDTISKLSFTDKKDFETGGFVPAVAMNRMEKFATRGLLGLFSSSRTQDEAMMNVKMNFRGNTVSFKEIEDYFRSTAKNNYKNIKEYVTLKAKAIKLVNQGKNEDGSMLVTTAVSTKTLMGDGVMERFKEGKFINENELVSMDLNKALHDFVHASMFSHGYGDFKGFVGLQSVIDGLLIHNRKKGFENQNKFVQRVMKDGFLTGNIRKNESMADKTLNGLIRANLLYILGYKALILQHGAYAINNLVVGKYHNIKNEGGRAWITGEKRYWGVSADSGFGHRKANGILKNLNYMTFNVYDEVPLENKHGLDDIFSDIALMPMTASENWTQKVHYLGLLTDEEWKKFDRDGDYLPGVEKISNQRLLEIEEEVKTAHGKGYQVIDQRMIQTYSWGRAIMQFARFIPTMVYDRFAPEDVNIYGQKHVGSLRKTWQVIHEAMSGNMSVKEFAAYRKSLPAHERKALDQGLRGMGLTTAAAFLGVLANSEIATELVGDSNYLMNPDKMQWKIVPSLVNTTKQIIL